MATTTTTTAEAATATATALALARALFATATTAADFAFSEQSVTVTVSVSYTAAAVAASHTTALLFLACRQNRLQNRRQDCSCNRNHRPFQLGQSSCIFAPCNHGGVATGNAGLAESGGRGLGGGGKGDISNLKSSVTC